MAVVIRRKIVSLQVLKHLSSKISTINAVVIRRKIVSLQVLKHLCHKFCFVLLGCDSQKNCIFASS